MPQATQTVVILQANPTPSATLTPTVTPGSITLPTNTPIELTQAVQLSIFEDLWATVNEEYLYQDFNGLDWDGIQEEYRSQINAGMTGDEFYLAMQDLIYRLGDDHSVFLNPQEVLAEDAEYAGNYDYVGVGIYVSAVPDRQRAVILGVFPNSPAESAGLQSRDNILAVDGQPILDEFGVLRDIIRGPEGTQVTLMIETPGQPPRELLLPRKRITTALPVPHTVFTTTSGQHIGYVFIVTFTDSGIDDAVGDVLKEMTQEAPLDGLIIDNRLNGGGVDTVLRPTLSYFTAGKLGDFISRDAERPLEVRKGININGSQTVPLVVLIGRDTVSYGEVFAGVLKDIGRAYLVGETTGGNVETLWGYDFEDGSRIWIARESFRPLNHPEQDWEKTGIIPDETVVANWDEYTMEDDPVIKAALTYFDR